jgi:hypothetical protein
MLKSWNGFRVHQNLCKMLAMFLGSSHLVRRYGLGKISFLQVMFTPYMYYGMSFLGILEIVTNMCLTFRSVNLEATKIVALLDIMEKFELNKISSSQNMNRAMNSAHCFDIWTWVSTIIKLVGLLQPFHLN